MLTCLPRSLCSWDFDVSGASSGEAALAFNFWTEQGSILLGGKECAVRKHGFLSGHWTLEHAGTTCADAQKPNALLRAFKIRADALQFTVKAQNAFIRSYDILIDGAIVGTIRPAHPFTRRAFIECDASVPELLQLFSFWLVVVTWRRAARNNASSSS